MGLKGPIYIFPYPRGFRKKHDFDVNKLEGTNMNKVGMKCQNIISGKIGINLCGAKNQTIEYYTLVLCTY